MAATSKPGEIESEAQSFACTRCGGQMHYSVQHAALHCEYCGHIQFERQDDATRPAQPVADLSEQVLDFVMPTTSGHQWAASQHRLSCDKCGAVSLLPAGQRASQCAYCGSNQLIDLSQEGELIDPQVIAVMSVTENQAMEAVKEWLGRGIFVPDDLLQATRKLRLRPAYYSGWTFDGTLEVPWSCEVQVDTGSNTSRWEPRNGVETRFFNDVLVPGVRSLKMKEMTSIEPFNLRNRVYDRIYPWTRQFLLCVPNVTLIDVKHTMQQTTIRYCCTWKVRLCSKILIQQGNAGPYDFFGITPRILRVIHIP